MKISKLNSNTISEDFLHFYLHFKPRLSRKDKINNCSGVVDIITFLAASNGVFQKYEFGWQITVKEQSSIKIIHALTTKFISSLLQTAPCDSAGYNRNQLSACIMRSTCKGCTVDRYAKL